MERLEVLSEKYATFLSEEIEWIRFGWNIDFVNEQSSDVDDLIIKTVNRLLYLRSRNSDEEYDDSTILIAELGEYDEKEFPLCVQSTPEDPILFARLCYDEGVLDTLKFIIGDRYLFIYGSEFNLIVLKSFNDVVDNDGRQTPLHDDSILFSSEALKVYYSIMNQGG